MAQFSSSDPVDRIPEGNPRRSRGLYLPLAVLILIGIVSGLLSYREYGVSWDEPLFYDYADAIGYAYSVRARIDGSFQLEHAFGPSAGDHKQYGPSYLLLARPIVLAWERLANGTRAEAWHLVNWLFFLVGVAAVYGLARRWLPRPSALAAAGLFATQPLLWGHAFINPKDVPFMTFFTLGVLAGFRMTDRLLGRPARPLSPVASSEAPSGGAPLAPRTKAVVVIVGLSLAAALALAYAFGGQIEAALRNLVSQAYSGPPESLLHRLFLAVAQDASRLPEDFYAERLQGLFEGARAAGLLLASLALPLSLHVVLRRSPSRPRLHLARAAASFRQLTFLPTTSEIPAVLLATIVPAVLLGLTAAVRILGPLAGALVCVYYLTDRRPRNLLTLVSYAAVAAAVAFVAWPYLWEAPLARLVEVARHMASNPAVLPVLFEGQILPSDGLPDSYLPTLLASTLTEPVWLLFFGGLVVALRRTEERRIEVRSLVLTVLWFALPSAYVLLARPPMYDGFRHFLFVLPPVFVVCGLSLQWIRERLSRAWAQALVLVLVLLPGVLGIVRLHPYSYAYFNAFVGGPAGAFRRYENDYWLTCYKELMEQAGEQPEIDGVAFALAQPGIAASYAPDRLTIEKFEEGDDPTYPGAYLLLPTRSNFDQAYHPTDPVVLAVSRFGATYCVLKQVVTDPPGS